MPTEPRTSRISPLVRTHSLVHALVYVINHHITSHHITLTLQIHHVPSEPDNEEDDAELLQRWGGCAQSSVAANKSKEWVGSCTSSFYLTLLSIDMSYLTLLWLVFTFTFTWHTLAVAFVFSWHDITFFQLHVITLLPSFDDSTCICVTYCHLNGFSTDILP